MPADRVRGALAVLVALATGLPAAASVTPPGDCEGLAPRSILHLAVPNRVLVKARGFTDFRSLIFLGRELRELVGVQPVGATGVLKVESPVLSTTDLLFALRSLHGADYVEPDILIEAHARREPDDAVFNFARRWAFEAVAAPEAWTYGQGDASVVVAVLDSGIHATHEDLRGTFVDVSGERLVHGTRVTCPADAFGFDAADGDCLPADRAGHGTAVAGIIGAAGDNKHGLAGVNWRVSILPVKTLDDHEEGCASRAARGLEFVRLWADEHPGRLKAVNLSWGTKGWSETVKEQLEELAERDVVIVASAGNGGTDTDRTPVYPAGYAISTLISVGAAARDRSLLGDSNYGARSVDIAAPGQRVYTCAYVSENVNYGYDYESRTSIAAPFVSGAVALVASQCPGLSAMELRNLILSSADRVKALQGRVRQERFLNLFNAVRQCAAINGKKKRR